MNSDEYEGHKITDGDFIKIGRVRLRVKEINIHGSESVPKDNGNFEKSSYGRACKFCLNEGYSENNLLIAPCRCTGTMKWIHYKCLQN